MNPPLYLTLITFSEKISKIRKALNSKDCCGEHIIPNNIPTNLFNFQPITLDETLKLIFMTQLISEGI